MNTRSIAAVILSTFACASLARADPPVSAPVASSAPPIATVILQPAQPSDTGAVAARDEGPGILFEDLPRDVGLRVRVLTRNQRVHVGVIKRADAHRVTLSVKQYGGSATYVLTRAQIERIDPA